MNKKGFTLVELIAVIAILGILTIITTPAVLSVRKKMLINSLHSKIEAIHEAALDYGNDNIMSLQGYVKYICNSETSCKIDTIGEDCSIVNVGRLITEGYLIADNKEKTDIINPINNESLNNKSVCIRYDNNDALNRKMFAYIIGESELLNWDKYNGE